MANGEKTGKNKDGLIRKRKKDSIRKKPDEKKEKTEQKVKFTITSIL